MMFVRWQAAVGEVRLECEIQSWQRGSSRVREKILKPEATRQEYLCNLDLPDGSVEHGFTLVSRPT